MPRGYYRPEYFHNPVIDKPIEDIYEDYQIFSCEIFPDEPQNYPGLDFMVPIPPMMYEGRFVKGLFLSQGVEALHRIFPELSDMFVSMAYTMSPAFSMSPSADALMTLYYNAHRNDWFRNRYPHMKDKPLIPLQDADFLSEYGFPPANQTRDLDLICVSRMHDLKNIPFLAKCLKAYRQKYPQQKIMLTLVIGKPFDINMEDLSPHEREQWGQVEKILEHPFDYIHLMPTAHFFHELPYLYSRAKICVLGALIEGKNRSIQEAMCCNTPVICNTGYNQYVRGETPIVLDGTGLYAAFDPEDWADKIHDILTNYDDFTPRRSYVEMYGRKNFINTCLDHIPYYQTALPGYEKGNHYNNTWLDLAVQANYQMSFHDFLYGKRHDISHVRGPDAIRNALKEYATVSGRGNTFVSFNNHPCPELRERIGKAQDAYQLETNYWDWVLSPHNTENREQIRQRLSREERHEVFPEPVAHYARFYKEKTGYPPLVLDLGSGPVSTLSHGVETELLRLCAVDPLADRYHFLLDKIGAQIPHKILSGFGEELSSFFGEGIFDIAWSRNTMDRALMPRRFFEEMVKVTKPGGLIILESFIPAGTFEHFSVHAPHSLTLNEGNELICETDSREEGRTVKLITSLSRDLPIELHEAVRPNPEGDKYMKTVWRKLS